MSRDASFEAKLFFCFVLFFLRFYLLIHQRQREREGERQRHRQKEKQPPCREPDVGLDPGKHALGRRWRKPVSHPGCLRSNILNDSAT